MQRISSECSGRIDLKLNDFLIIVCFSFCLYIFAIVAINNSSDTHKPDEDQLIVHCTIFSNPEPTIRWFKEKIALNLFSLPRYKIFNHPDDLHEHTIASLIVESPSWLDNGDFIIEVENEMGCERRVLNVQFQTEEEYNAIYFQKYLEHKENLKYHQYQPGEQRWEDIVPEIKEFVFWLPPEEEEDKNKPQKPGESGDEEEEEEEGEEEEEVFTGWSVPGEGGGSEEEDEDEEVKVEEPIAEVPAAEPEPEPAPVEEPPKEPTPEPEVEEAPPEEEPAVEEFLQDQASGSRKPSKQASDGGFDWSNSFEPTEEVEPVEVYKRKEPEVEHPIILNRPKFYITDFQLRKKFHFVNKLFDIQMMKGKTLRMESYSASIGPVSCEWHHNGRLVTAPTYRKSIEFHKTRNMTVLEIENVRVQDSGTYTVTHYNNYTEPLIDSCKVLITVPQPKETADQPPSFTRLLTGINHYRVIRL